MCTGDLGTNTELLKHNLVETTSLAHKWGTIILINKTNIYLERSLQNIQYNNLVSVFLYYLEYFQDIIFLIINRITIFDNIFRSRIIFAIKFDNLNINIKRKI